MFSILLVLFAIAGLALSLFLIILLLLSSKNYQNVEGDSTVIIVKIVESHRENLPISAAHGWYLVPCNCNLRCWKKDLSFNLLGSSVTVYGCSKEINCAAVILLNVIADISTWPEWDVQAQDQNVHLELPENPSLHGDAYMQCDQIVLTCSKLKAKPEIEMFRFGNLESNGTGWILLWNAKQLDWTLYIAQPIDKLNRYSSDDDDEYSAENKCLLTAMWGCEPKQGSKRNMPEILCTKVLNLSEAISYCQLKIRPFQSIIHSSSLSNPHFPTIHSALNDLPSKPCVLLRHEKKEQLASFQNKVLALVSLSPQKPATVKNISGFSLALYPLKKVSKSTIMNGEYSHSEDKRKSRRRHKNRSDSMTADFPRLKHLDIERRSSSLTAPIRKKLPELTITKPEEELKSPQRASSHSFLDVLFQRRHSSDASGKRSRSPSPNRAFLKEEIKNDKSSFSGPEDLGSRSYQDLDASDVSDTEISLFKIENESMDFKSLGEYSISAVLQENIKAASVDVNVSEEEQKKLSGGWIFKEMYKDLAIFKKISHFESCAVISYLCKGVISSPQSTVWKTLCNPQTRLIYDDTVKRITVLKEYASGQKLIHMVNESGSLLRKKVQDLCLLQTEKKEGNQYILGFHSVKIGICPSTKDVARGTIIASGWIVEPVQDNATYSQVSYLTQTVVPTAEISTIEENYTINSQCIYNLNLYLASQPLSLSLCSK